jgi:glutamate/tyrosine decarboxylase-like PLP-dependent enzyme
MKSPDAIDALTSWMRGFGAFETLVSKPDKEQAVLNELAQRLTGNYPFFHPVYAGQMLKPPARIAMEAYRMAMLINPNNHALDGGPPTSEMEKEVVQLLAGMFGFGENTLGHLTSGGTVANLEALWVARNLHPEKAVAASAAAHYTHRRMAGVLNMPFIEIPVDASGKMDVNAFLEKTDNIGTLVVTLGTTGLGLVEPLHELLPLCRERGIRVHVDAAYGGFFRIVAASLKNPRPWLAMKDADSIVVDPHKHGLQPYGCGCVLFRDATVGRFYKHDSPYTYFSSKELHLGEISLECSRAGAAAAAFWATLNVFPLTEEGLGKILKHCISAAQLFAQQLANSGDFAVITEPELDIVAYFPNRFKRTSDISDACRKIFKNGMEDADKPIFVSLFTMESAQFTTRFPEIVSDSATVTVVRSVLMKPEQESWVPELVARLQHHLSA